MSIILKIDRDKYLDSRELVSLLPQLKSSLRWKVESVHRVVRQPLRNNVFILIITGSNSDNEKIKYQLRIGSTLKLTRIGIQTQ